jgi:hypothetical protein
MLDIIDVSTLLTLLPVVIAGFSTGGGGTATSQQSSEGRSFSESTASQRGGSASDSFQQALSLSLGQSLQQALARSLGASTSQSTSEQVSGSTGRSLGTSLSQGFGANVGATGLASFAPDSPLRESFGRAIAAFGQALATPVQFQTPVITPSEQLIKDAASNLVSQQFAALSGNQAQRGFLHPANAPAIAGSAVSAALPAIAPHLIQLELARAQAPFQAAVAQEQATQGRLAGLAPLVGGVQRGLQQSFGQALQQATQDAFSRGTAQATSEAIQQSISESIGRSIQQAISEQVAAAISRSFFEGLSNAFSQAESKSFGFGESRRQPTFGFSL